MIFFVENAVIRCDHSFGGLLARFSSVLGESHAQNESDRADCWRRRASVGARRRGICRSGQHWLPVHWAICLGDDAEIRSVRRPGAALVTRNQALMVFDTVFALDVGGNAQYQMRAGHTVDADQKIWTLTLRAGPMFHDNTPVLARDVVASLRRWGCITSRWHTGTI